MDDTLYESQQAEYEQLSRYLDGKLSLERGGTIVLKTTEERDGTLSTQEAERALEGLRIENRVIKEKYRGLISPTLRANNELSKKLDRKIAFIIQQIDTQEEKYTEELGALQTQALRSKAIRSNTTQEDRGQTDTLFNLQPALRKEVTGQQKNDGLNTDVRTVEEEQIQDSIQQTQLSQYYSEAENELDAQTKEEKTNELVQKIKKHLNDAGLSGNEVFTNLKAKTQLGKVIEFAQLAKTGTPYHFPVFLLGSAICIDLIELINTLPAAGFVTLVVTTILKWSVFMPFVFFTTFSEGNFIMKRLMRKFLVRSATKRIYFIIISPLVELIPFLGAFWPGTFLFVLWLVNVKTSLGQLLLKAASPTKQDDFKELLQGRE